MLWVDVYYKYDSPGRFEMRHIIDALIVGTIAAVLALPMGAPAGGSGNQRGKSSSSVQIGLDVRVDSDWISLNGTWSVLPAVGDEEKKGVTHELTIGAVPNMAGRARKGAALVRAIRTTAICVAKHVLKDQLEINRPEGK
jgi:hypothetical protein